MHSTTTSLIEGLRTGNTASLEKFKRLYSPAVLKLCRDTCDDPKIADEIATQAILVVLGRSQHFQRREGKKFRNYVKTVAISQIKDYWRKHHSLKRRLKQQNFTEQFDRFVLRRTIAALKENRSFHEQSWEMFHLHYEQKLSVEAVAAKYDVAVDSVKRTLRRIRNEIRAALDD